MNRYSSIHMADRYWNCTLKSLVYVDDCCQCQIPEPFILSLKLIITIIFLSPAILHQNFIFNGWNESGMCLEMNGMNIICWYANFTHCLIHVMTINYHYPNSGWTNQHRNEHVINDYSNKFSCNNLSKFCLMLQENNHVFL